MLLSTLLALSQWMLREWKVILKMTSVAARPTARANRFLLVLPRITCGIVFSWIWRAWNNIRDETRTCRIPVNDHLDNRERLRLNGRWTIMKIVLRGPLSHGLESEEKNQQDTNWHLKKFLQCTSTHSETRRADEGLSGRFFFLKKTSTARLDSLN